MFGNRQRFYLMEQQTDVFGRTENTNTLAIRLIIFFLYTFNMHPEIEYIYVRTRVCVCVYSQQFNNSYPLQI